VGARKSQRPRGHIIATSNVFCCDSAALIDLRDAGLLRKLRALVQKGRTKIPEGVYKELQQKTDKLAKTIEQWEKNKDKYEKNPDPLLIKGLDFSQRILKKIDSSFQNKQTRRIR